MSGRLRLDRYSKLLLLTILLAAISRVANGQDPVPLKAGARVRVRSTETGGKWRHGELLRIDGDSLSLGTERDTLLLAADSVKHLQVSQGRKSNAMNGLTIGAGVGFGLGVILSVAAAQENCQGLGCYQVTTADAFVISMLLAAVGGGVGALIGSGSHSEKWAEVQKPWAAGRVRPAVTALGPGMAIEF